MHKIIFNASNHIVFVCLNTKDITIINFGIGSPNAATIMDLLSAIDPKAVLFLGKCGGLKRKNQLGDLILPIAAIRGEGTSNDYFPPEVPALPAFALQKSISSIINRKYNKYYYTGTVYTTNRRVWEWDTSFKQKLRICRAMERNPYRSIVISFRSAYGNRRRKN